jgi:DNA-binding FrmR family transcriptional regulator
MAHTIREKTKLIARVRRIRGQVEAVERALASETECTDVLRLIASVRGAVNGLMGEVMEDHILEHVVWRLRIGRGTLALPCDSADNVISVRLAVRICHTELLPQFRVPESHMRTPIRLPH